MADPLVYALCGALISRCIAWAERPCGSLRYCLVQILAEMVTFLTLQLTALPNWNRGKVGSRSFSWKQSRAGFSQPRHWSLKKKIFEVKTAVSVWGLLSIFFCLFFQNRFFNKYSTGTWIKYKCESNKITKNERSDFKSLRIERGLTLSLALHKELDSKEQQMYP